MKKNNIEIIKDFLSRCQNETLLINSVTEETACFYEGLIKNLAILAKVKLFFNESSTVINTSNELFDTKNIYIYFTTNGKQIEETSKLLFPKIIFTDYKNYKKYIKKYIVINGYESEKDISYYIKNFFNINNQDLIDYCISQPHLAFSELSKYTVNSEKYEIDTAIRNEDNFIAEIRKDIFKLKRSQSNLKKIFFKLKDEAKYKKFNFLAY